MRSSTDLSARQLQHRGWSVSTAILSLIGVSVPLLAAWNFLPGFLRSEPTANVLTAEVTLGSFINRVLEQGEIESSSSVEIRCEVRSHNSSGTNILEIVPEGTRVEKGDFLARLDDSALRMDLIQQQITCSGSESLMIEAEAAMRSAELAKTEYEEGSFREQRETLESALVVAQENLRRAEEYLAYSQKLAERGYVSQVQLEADRFAVEKARKELGVAQTKLEVLEKFSKAKMLMQLNADIQTSKARFEARQKTWELDKQRLKEIEDQIAKCVIVAPTAGQVVYANDSNRGRSSGDTVIAEGVPVRERQLLFRLPDPSRMRVLAKVHESRISQIRKGLTAEVIADALPDRPLTGTVVTVSEYPIPSTSVYTTHIKEYAVEVEIHSPPPQLRPGMSAQVNILVEHLDSQLQIPIDAAISRGDRYFVAVPRQDGTFETREIKVGSANDTIITIRSGLEVGEKVVLNHREIAHKLDLPELKGPNAPDTEAVAATTETQPAAAADSSVLKTPAVADGKTKPTSDTTSLSAK
jgi:multidrug efflux pump subunit AcrA (membrane-fusion protein)